MVHWSIFMRIYLPAVADKKMQSKPETHCDVPFNDTLIHKYWYVRVLTCIIFSIHHLKCPVFLDLWSLTPTTQRQGHQHPNISSVLSSEKASVLPRGKNPWHDPLKFLSTHLQTTIPRKSAYNCHNGCVVFLFSVNFKSFKPSHIICFYLIFPSEGQ